MKYFNVFFIVLGIISVVPSAYAQTKLMTYNIRYNNPNDGDNWWEHRKTAVVELLQYYDPDFIGLQEVLPGQLEFVKRHLNEYDAIGYGRDGVDTNSESAPLLYNKSKYEVLKREQFWLSESPTQISKGWDAALNRITVYGAFKNKVTNDTIHVFNAHFDHRGKVARHKSAELILEYISNNHLENKKVVLMGDFNSEPLSSPIMALSHLLEDSYNSKGSVAYGPIGTFNGFETQKEVTRRIDYIFTKNLKVQSYRCIDDRRKNNLHVSDHFAILIEI